MLKISGLSKSYQNHNVVSDISLELEKGSFHAIIGTSGAGKTTLLKMIAGYEQPDDGVLSLNGEPLTPLKDMLVKGYEEIKLVHQDYALKPNMTVLENVNYALIDYNEDYKKQRTSDVIAACHLNGMEQKQIHQLSGGQKQRVSIARALATEPEVLLMDEPFSNLDPMTKNDLLQESKEISQQTETTILLVTHDTRDAMEVADHLHILSGGKFIQTGNPKSIYQKPTSLEVASMLGYINSLDEGKRGIWAEHVKLGSGDYEGSVVATSFKGAYQMISMSCPIFKKPIIAYDFSSRYQIGDQLSFELQEKQFINFTTE